MVLFEKNFNLIEKKFTPCNINKLNILIFL